MTYDTTRVKKLIAEWRHIMTVTRWQDTAGDLKIYTIADVLALADRIVNEFERLLL